MAESYSTASFGGGFTNLKTFVQYTEAGDWTVASDRVEFRYGGGVTSSYYFNVQGIAMSYGWWESGVFHTEGTGTLTYNRNGGDEWAFPMGDGYFTRFEYDRTVYLWCEGYFAEGGTAYAESPAFTVPHLAAAPSNLTATRNTDTRITLNWTNPSTSYDRVYIQYQRNGGSWTALTNQTASTSYTWTTAVADSAYNFRVYTTYQNSTSGYSNTAKAYTTPTAPSSLTATRNSDNKVTLSWTNNSSSYTKTYIERQTDGGSWSNLANVAKGTTSYADTTTSSDHAYKYRVRAYNGGRYSSYATSSAVTMSPARPTSMTTSAIQGSTNVEVTLENPSTISTGIKWQYSTDGTSWLPSTPNSVSGSPVTSFTATVSGSVYIRVCNTNSLGDSAWIVSEKVTTICPPAAPTLTSPSNVWNTADGGVVFSWRHNPLDGSSQTAYELRYARNGGAWTTLSGTTAQTRTVAISSFTVGDSVSWQVRTKGADANYSDWAQAQAFSVYSAPTVTITSPGATVTSMPISMAATYSDMAGFTCQAATVSLQHDGRTLYSESATINGTSITSSLDVSEFLPTNGESYTVVVTARSSSGLQTTANATFAVSFTEPAEGALSIVNDLDNGYASITATYDNAGAAEPAVSISVARVNADGTITPLLTDGASGSGFVDRYAPLNTAYQYAVTTKASTQAVKTVYVDNVIESDYWFAYWGENVAKAKWNPDNGGIQITRPSKTRVYYAGRRDPVSYDGHAVALTETPSWMFIGKDEVDVFVKLIEDGGRGIYKSCDGWVYHADFDLTLTPSYTAIGYYGGASLGITRIAGERL